MPVLSSLVSYLRNLNAGRLILWCYFIWYSVSVALYFDPDPRIWLNAAGICIIIGTALWINASRSGSTFVRLERWPIIRLYLFPFCVSSFSATAVRTRAFRFIFPPRVSDSVLAIGLCGLLCAAVFLLKRTGSSAKSD